MRAQYPWPHGPIIPTVLLSDSSVHCFHFSAESLSIQHCFGLPASPTPLCAGWFWYFFFYYHLLPCLWVVAVLQF